MSYPKLKSFEKHIAIKKERRNVNLYQNEFQNKRLNEMVSNT